MEIYLVGGAVRDRLLGRPVSERDWVVVGASAEDMLRAGYRQVGKDFPVFLHPQTHEEYALARTERKTRPGYHGFEFDTEATVTLEQDLQRRDLTINAIAEDSNGRLIDPWGGLDDLRAGRLRHVSPAFAEDPVRILRLARFAARFAPLGFSVAPETLTLMRSMVEAGEVDALVAERVWQEMAKALREAKPSRFVVVLRECGALGVILPEVDALFGIPQAVEYHPEIDTGEHLLLSLDQAAQLDGSDSVGFAVLCHDLGKTLTPAEELPRHHGHEKNAAPLIDGLSERLKVPRQHKDLAQLVARYHLHCHRALELRPSSIVRLLGRLDGWRRPERFEQFLRACEADARGRRGRENAPYPQADHLRRALAITTSIDSRAVAAACSDRQRIPAALDAARSQALKTDL